MILWFLIKYINNFQTAAQEKLETLLRPGRT